MNSLVFLELTLAPTTRSKKILINLNSLISVVPIKDKETEISMSNGFKIYVAESTKEIKEMIEKCHE